MSDDLKRYKVKGPVVCEGIAYVIAESEQDAIDRFLNGHWEDLDEVDSWDVEPTGGLGDAEILDVEE